jgi:hypothetical protein
MTDWWTNAANYDLIHKGKFGATMADISNFRNSDKIAIPTNIQPLTIEFDHFCTTWLQGCRTKPTWTSCGKLLERPWKNDEREQKTRILTHLELGNCS